MSRTEHAFLTKFLIASALERLEAASRALRILNSRIADCKRRGRDHEVAYWEASKSRFFGIKNKLYGNLRTLKNRMKKIKEGELRMPMTA